MANKKQTPSSIVDQKQLVNDKAKAMQERGDEHIRRVTPNGADGQ
ncbi:hypothetical protein NSQ51_07875 [Geobacillus sp. FSL K6-0789]|uniref:Uncharacterized protein n=1 Tax=Geobacillus stearothermophilus TaxID=1422 RepID=A0A150N2T9_GEOSE|nr:MULTISPECIES: hypothetical protein [Geobacillus]KAF6511520.1 hypothetical protein GS8_1096 [Geobacillus stearothermophilus]KYD24017.1 hypothetical protein B4109_1396 [Geobacillus stearothermophilus]KYD31004.1 hypothetical protein B4114_1416 [Geobacillus stearothermophilus]MED3664942.1 hypothetical protein [Geobacillus stearothermophilus]MED3731961.1 hypothetical protein [Geobacillus stearothermophilus]